MAPKATTVRPPKAGGAATARAGDPNEHPETDAPTSGAPTTLSSLGIADQIQHLKEAFRPEPTALPAEGEITGQPGDAGTQQAPSPSSYWSVLRQRADADFVRRILKTAVALAVAIFVGWGPMQRLLRTTSVEAVVNARLVTLRAPIDGHISAEPSSLKIGAAVDPGETLLKIVDPRADRARLDDLTREVGRVEDERTMLSAKIAGMRDLHARFVEQTRQFQEGRVQQLRARGSEIRSDLAAARARREETAAVLERAIALEAKGAATRAQLDKARREDEIAAQAIAAAEHRLKGVEIELAGAQSGSFLGDSYNDRPSSAQRADELQQQISAATAELSHRDRRLAHLREELAREQARYAQMSEATIAAPTQGSVWETLTSPGEDVRRGQELLRLLDCSSSIVTAAVSESVYNSLRLGQPATFRFRDGGPEYQGRIVHLTGVADAPANFAITPSALTREPYRATVAIPGLANTKSCSLGRTGLVTFGAKPETRPPANSSAPTA